MISQSGSFGDFKLPSMIGVSMPIIGIADADNGRAIMNFLPQEGTTSKYITAVKVVTNILFLQTVKFKTRTIELLYKRPCKVCKAFKSEQT